MTQPFTYKIYTPLLRRALGDIPEIPCWEPKKAKKAKKNRKENRTREEAIKAGGNITGKPQYHWGPGGPKAGQQLCPLCTAYGRHKCSNPDERRIKTEENDYDSWVLTDPETGMARISGCGCGPCSGPNGN